MKRLLPIAAVAAGFLILPQQAQAADPPGTDALWPSPSETCGGATLTVCVDFELFQDQNDSELFYFRVSYLGLQDNGDLIDSGRVTAVGLHDHYAAFEVWDHSVEYDYSSVSSGWSTNTHGGGCHLQGGGEQSEGSFVFAGCASADAPPVQNGLAQNDFVTFSFRSNPTNLEDALIAGTLTGRAHIQALPEDCSIKLDSELGAFSDCTVTVSEPGLVLLLGTGLLGIFGMAVVRRRREDEVDGMAA